MKFLPAPPPKEFDVYVDRPDTRYVECEKDENLSAIYAQGYLPYSGGLSTGGIFYSARSARIVIAEFELSSENRRVAKKFDGMFEKTTIAGSPGTQAVDFCLTYFANKHGPQVMPAARLNEIFQRTSHTTAYTHEGTVVGYVLSICDSTFGHYWYSFYDLRYTRQSLGLWLMLDAIRDAKAAGLTYYYLGTVYGPKALYKTNFQPLEWWNGAEWSRDLAKLKELARKD